MWGREREKKKKGEEKRRRKKEEKEGENYFPHPELFHAQKAMSNEVLFYLVH